MEDTGRQPGRRFGDPRFNGGQNVRIHDGDATRLVVDDGEERRFQVDAGDGHDLTARAPAGTVGAEPAPSAPGGVSAATGGPRTHLRTHDQGDALAESFGNAPDTFDGSRAGWTEEPAAAADTASGAGGDDTPQATGDVGAPPS